MSGSTTSFLLCLKAWWSLQTHYDNLYIFNIIQSQIFAHITMEHGVSFIVVTLLITYTFFPSELMNEMGFDNLLLTL